MKKIKIKINYFVFQSSSQCLTSFFIFCCLKQWFWWFNFSFIRTDVFRTIDMCFRTFNSTCNVSKSISFFIYEKKLDLFFFLKKKHNIIDLPSKSKRSCAKFVCVNAAQCNGVVWAHETAIRKPEHFDLKT